MYYLFLNSIQLDTYETINYKRKNERNINLDAKYYTGKLFQNKIFS